MDQKEAESSRSTSSSAAHFTAHQYLMCNNWMCGCSLLDKPFIYYSHSLRTPFYCSIQCLDKDTATTTATRAENDVQVFSGSDFNFCATIEAICPPDKMPKATNLRIAPHPIIGALPEWTETDTVACVVAGRLLCPVCYEAGMEAKNKK